MPPDTAPTVSVVVSTRGRPELLRRCLGALDAGDEQPDEVVVVDQGVDDAAASVVSAAGAGGLRIIHVRQAGRGLSRSQNEGVRVASGEVVGVVDDDCVPDAQWVAVIRTTFAAPDAPDLVGGRIMALPPTGDRIVAVSSRTSDRRVEHRWPARPWEVGSGGNFAVRRAAYLAVGGNDERLGTGSPGRAGNDLDLFHRLLKEGNVARYEPDLVVHHERATVGERRERRFSYGFGVGASVGRWLRDGDRSAWRVLGAWFRLRAGELRRRRLSALADEARVLLGTAAGLVYGLRQADPWTGGPS